MAHLYAYLVKKAGIPRAPPSFDADRAYKAFVAAETGDPEAFIRTKYAPAGGSTAYGPAQLTKRKLQDYRKRYRDRLKPPSFL